MASEGGGKIKNKRGHSSSKPYERRKSFFSRITDTIKDALRPSWLTASNTESHQTQSIPEKTADEEEEEFVSPAQSPSQLQVSAGLGFGTTEQSLLSHPYQDSSHAPADRSVRWQQRSQGSAWESHRPRRSTWGNSTNTFDKSQITSSFFAQKHLEGNKATENTMEISKGLGGEPSSRQFISTTSSRQRPPIPEPDMTTVSQQEQTRRESIWESSSTCPEENPSKRQRLWSPNTTWAGKSSQSPAYRPAFKISVFSSPKLSESMHESSFYSGKTTYGGASAYRRSNLNSSLPYQNSLPIRKSLKVKPLNNSGNAVLSSSATQILKTLERLSDAKRSRVNETESGSLLSFTPTSYRKPSRPLQTSLPSRSLELSVRGPPTSRLQSPLAASIARNRQIVSIPVQRSQNPSATVEQSSQENRDSEDTPFRNQNEMANLQQRKSHGTSVQQKGGSCSESSVFPEVSTSRSSGKMKHPKSYDTRHGKPSGEEDEVVEIPNLRTDFTLPVGSIPAINFGFSSSSEKPSTSTKPATNSSMSISNTALGSSPTVTSQSIPKLQFTFSSPIQKSGPGNSQASSSPAADFRFSSPLKVSQSMCADDEEPPKTSQFGVSTSSSDHTTPAAWGSTAPKPKSIAAGNSNKGFTSGFGSCPTPGVGYMLVPNTNTKPHTNAKSSSIPSLPAPQLKSGSVMDVLSKSPQTSSPASSVKTAGQLKQGSVMDILGGKKDNSFGSPGASLKPASELKTGSVMDILSGKSAATSGTDSLFSKFALPQGSWECDACMLQNKPESTKCVACKTRKPGDKPKATAPASSQQSVSSGSDVFAKFAKPAGSWECDACMLQNKVEASKCVACGSPKPGAASAPAGSSMAGSEDLFSKFAAPAGTWDCEACMLQNKPEATKCVACETPKRGGNVTSSTPTFSDSLMAKFQKPAGSWDCDVCMVQNPGTQTKCLACETPKPGAQSTGIVPPPAPSIEVVAGKGGGMVFNLPQTAASSSAFLAGSSAASTQPSSGFTFGQTSSSSTTPGGFQMATSSSGAKDSAAARGFTFGKDNSNSNSASSIAASTGFQLGTKTSSTATSLFTVPTASDSKTSSAAVGSGFQFGVSSSSSTPSASTGFVFGGSAVSTVTTTATSSKSPSVTAGGFGLPTSSVEGFQFGSLTQSQNKALDTKNGEDKVSSSSGVSAEGGMAQTGHSFTPVFGAGKPVNSAPLGAGPSLVTGSANPLTSGAFQFPVSANSKNSAGSMFGSGVSCSASDSKTENNDTGSHVPSLTSGFSFAPASAKSNSDDASKPGLFTFTSDSKNKSITPQPTSASHGFGFGAASSTASNTSSIFGSTPPVSVGGFGAAPASKQPVNGEIGAPGVFAFGQQSAAGSAATAGFSFGGAGTKDANSLQKPHADAQQPFSFGTEASKSLGQKRRLDNDVGPGDAKKRSDTGLPLTGGSEPFAFGIPTTVGGNSVFGQTPKENALGKGFDGQASGFGNSMQGGFSFGIQTNAASSTGIPPVASVFGAGAGTGQSSIGMGSGPQSSAAAASPFGVDTPALSVSQKAAGFNFASSTQPVFNFGGNNGTNAPATAFQFSAQQPTDAAPAQPAGSGGVFMFGQSAPSADTSAQPSAFSAIPSSGFGAAPAQGGFNIGSGDSQRKIKKAIRRTVRK